jgi:hypothetical protein
MTTFANSELAAQSSLYFFFHLQTSFQQQHHRNKNTDICVMNAAKVQHDMAELPGNKIPWCLLDTSMHMELKYA